MTTIEVEETIGKFRAEADQAFKASLPQLAQTLIAHGADDEEFSAAMDLARQMFDAAIETQLERLRAWLQRDGATLQ